MVAPVNEMQLDSVPWRDLIVKGAGQLGVTVTADHLRQFALFASELVRWNAKANLTRILSPRDMALKHFVDSLAAVSLMETGKAVLDIGSGAGFPGIVLKILCPGIAMTLIDAVGKKVGFQRHVIRQLGLCAIEALHVRAEDLARQKTGAFDVAVCRALADVDRFWRLAAPMLRPGGMAVAYKGKISEAELAAIRPASGQAAPQVAVRSYRLPLDGSQRTLVVLVK